jgi:integrase
MDAPEYFQNVVVPDYNAFVASPTEYRLLEAIISSMDKVPERLALHQLGYALRRSELISLDCNDIEIGEAGATIE